MDNNIPVVGTEAALALGLQGSNIISEEEAVKLLKESPDTPIYTNSENAIDWISKNLSFTDLPEKINLFKNKVRFRKLTESLFPDFFFKEVHIDDLNNISIDEVPLPFIIKPAVGFFSLGVYKVTDKKEWAYVVSSINSDIEKVKGIYPEAVLDTTSFIIEQCINGEEFAVDTYFDSNGEPVITNIHMHPFSSDSDVSDRVYITSKKIIETNLDEFTEFAAKIGALAGIKNFPVHIELRRDTDGTILPIEVNPMRFGGWCTTADMALHAYGFNPYIYFYTKQKPDWTELLKGKEGKLFSLVVLENSTGTDTDEITSFDYEKLLSWFEKPMELRRVDYKTYQVFAFLFTETREDNFVELQRILDSDLREFVTVG